MGGIILHGPHHSAEKSTNTGLSDAMISWKFAMMFLDLLQDNAFIRDKVYGLMKITWGKQYRTSNKEY
jgi:hypothetical protein